MAIAIIIAGLYAYGVWPRPIYNTDIGSLSYEMTEPLTGNAIVEQSFLCDDKGLESLNIRLSKLDHETMGSYDWQVKEVKSGNIIGKGVLDEKATDNKLFRSSSPQKNGTVVLSFDKQKDSKGKEYVLSLQSKQVKEDESMALYITEKGDAKSSLKVKGKELEETSVMKMQYKRFNVETFIVFLGIVVYLTVFVKFMYKLFR